MWLVKRGISRNKIILITIYATCLSIKKKCCFKNLTKLPVEYEVDKQSWTIFNEYLFSSEKHFACYSRKTVLLKLLSCDLKFMTSDAKL